MDYGSDLAKQFENPNRRSRHYVRQSTFEGSQRQLRGQVLSCLLRNSPILIDELCGKLFDKSEAEVS